MSVICGNVAVADLAITRQTLNRQGESDGIRSYLETFFLPSFIHCTRVCVRSFELNQYYSTWDIRALKQIVFDCFSNFLETRMYTSHKMRSHADERNKCTFFSKKQPNVRELG